MYGYTFRVRRLIASSEFSKILFAKFDQVYYIRPSRLRRRLRRFTYTHIPIMYRWHMRFERQMDRRNQIHPNNNIICPFQLLVNFFFFVMCVSVVYFLYVVKLPHQ